MFSQIITVWKKEIKDTIRDRRTLTATIIIPMVLMPLLIIGTGKLVEYQMKSLQEQTVTLSITGENYAQDLVADIKKQNGVEITKTESQNAEEDVKNGVIDGALIIPPSFEQDVKGLKPVQVNLLFKSTSGKTASIEPKIDMAISNFNNQILKGRFLDQKINPTILSMVSLLSQDVATSQEKSGFGLGLLLPVFIVIWSITGGQYTAIDASAG